MRGALLSAVLLLFAFCACSSSDSGGTLPDATIGDGPQNDPQACVKAGGTCGCAGGCQPGFHPASGSLLYACPQPCDQCGACSQQCCIPDAVDAGTDAADGGGADGG